MGFIKDAWDGLTGKSAAEASNQAAATSADAQREALAYLREQDEIPSQYREGALGVLGGLFGLNANQSAPPRPTFTPSPGGGFVGGMADSVRQQQYQQDLDQWESRYGSGGSGGAPSQQQALGQIEQNPIFQATMGLLPMQEQAILRNQSATGGMRSGGTDMMLAENQRTNRLSALQNTIGGLQGLAGLQSYAPQIAQGMAGIGSTLAQGQVAGAQARQSGLGSTIGLGLQGLGLAAAFSDVRLKANIKPAGERSGHDWYTWEWTEEAGEMGLVGESEGVLAQDVILTHPDAVSLNKGYFTVDYAKLGL